MIMAAYFMRTKLSQYSCIFSLKLPHSFSFSFFILLSLLPSLPPPLLKMQIIKTSSFRMIFFRDKLKKIFIIFFMILVPNYFIFLFSFSSQWNKIQKISSWISIENRHEWKENVMVTIFTRIASTKTKSVFFIIKKKWDICSTLCFESFFCIFKIGYLTDLSLESVLWHKMLNDKNNRNDIWGF